MKHALLTLCAVMACILAIVGCTTPTGGDAKSAHPGLSEMEAATGDETLFAQKCSACHALDRVQEAYRTMSRDEMRAVIERMSAKDNAGIEGTQVEEILREIYGEASMN